MAEIVRMPLLSDTMTEGVIVEWHKEIGDAVESGDLLAEIETDKATMEFESYEDGVLLFRAEANKPIAINAILAVIGEEGEDVAILLNNESAETTALKATESSKKEVPIVPQSSPMPSSVSTVANGHMLPSNLYHDDNERLKASPLAKRLAREHTINLRAIKGTGTEGRIIKRDVEAFLQQHSTKTPPTIAAPPTIQVEPEQRVTSLPKPKSVEISSVPRTPSIPQHTAQYEDFPLSQMRKTIARRLSESKFGAPHFYLKMIINMDKVMSTRKQLNEISPVKISFNDFVVKAAAMSLRQHPVVNSSWLGDVIRQNKEINVGIAVAVPDGLMVPVIHNADNKSLSQLAEASKALAGKARNKKLQLSEMQGNTFSISNLGMFGIDEFTAIINPPDACIMAVGAITKVPAIINDEIKVAAQMKVTLSCDHRVVDGATGAKFLQTFKSLLEEPMKMLV